MRIHTKIIWNRDGEVILNDFFSYEGPVSHAGGSSQKSVAQTSTGPWTAQQPYLKTGFEQALQQYNSDKPSFYPGSTVTPYSSQTMQGIGGLESAAQGSSLPQDASTQLSRTMAGDFMSNPETWASRLSNPNANVMAGMAGNENQDAYAQAGMNPNANATSSLATNGSMNAYNPNAGTYNPNAGVKADVGFNPYAGVKGDIGFNPYLTQGMNDYIGNVTNAVSRSVVPQVRGAYGASGRTGESPLAQGAIAKGIADAVAPYQFGSAEAEMGRRFSGGESLAGRAQSSSENQMQRLYGSGADYAGRAQSASENQAGRLYGAGSDYAQQLYGSGENLAQRQFAGGETEAARAQGINDALAGRQFSAGETYAGRDQAARDALASRQFAAGESLAGAQRGEASAQAARQYSAGENAITRGMNTYEAERSRELAAAGMAPELEAARYQAPNALLQAGALQDQKAQEYTDENINRYNYEQNLPAQKLADFMSMITGNYGQAGTNIANAKGQQSPFSTFAQIGSGIGGLGAGMGK